MNLEKTTVLPINTENMTQVTPKITIKQQLQTIKILGRYFNENLKLSNQINLEITLEKM